MASYASQCFPARNLLRFKKNSGSEGAWLVAYKEEQNRRFNAVLCPDNQNNQIQNDGRYRDNERSLNHSKRKQTELSGIYLLNELNVDDPSDIASINIIAKDLVTAKHEDFVLFDNVEHIEAGENQLTLDSFKTFPILRELELQLNNINQINIAANDFQYLEMLDVSYNNIMEEDILALGTLPMLKCLCLSGNGLKHLPILKSRNSPVPQEGALQSSQRKPLFEFLEILALDDNEFENNLVFASLASLPRLKILNLSKNYLRSVPLLHPANSKTNSNSSVADIQDLNQHPNFHHPETEYALQLDSSVGKLVQENDNEIPDYVFDGIDELDLDFHAEDSNQVGEHETQNIANLANNKPFDLDLPQDHSQYPFMHLEKLDISKNVIEEEDALLPLAAWPSLIEVNIWDNPLTRNCKGPPPLLQYHLSKLCGIELNRKKTKALKKPAVGPVIAPAVKFNKVTEMPSIKRSNMLMLEFESYENALQNGSLYKKPLPSITPNNIDNDNNHNRRDTHSAPTDSKIYDNDLKISDERTRPYSVAQDQFFPKDAIVGESEKGKSKDNGERNQDLSDGVFLTQVDGAEENDIEENHDPELHTEKNDEKIKRSSKNEPDNNYSKYEEILQIDGTVDGIETPPAEDLRGNIKALHHALRHPLVFNEPAIADSERQIYTQHKEIRSPASKTQRRGNKVKDVIDNMKGQSNIIEQNLDAVLERYDTDPEIRKQFPEVKKLLNEVQSKYNKVRLKSLETASNAQKLLKTSSKPVRNTLNNRSIDTKKLQKLPTLSSLEKDLSLSSKHEYKRTQPSNIDDVNETISKFKSSVDKRI